MIDLYERVRDEYGRVDVLFNNAGINPPDDTTVTETTIEAWERVQAVNVRGVFLCCKHGIPHLLEQGGGSVINTASFVAVMGAAVSQISYTASKGAVLAMSRELGVEFARRGVRVNALCPGPINTPLLQELFASDPGKAARRLVHLPMGRFGEPSRDRQGGDLPRLRRLLLHHRLDLHGRRRALRRLSDAGDRRVGRGRRQEPPAQTPAELVPGRPAGDRLGTEQRRVDPDPDRVLVGAVVVDPERRVRRRDLGVELDPPGGPVEPVGLDADRAAREHLGPRRRQALVAVPLEGLEARGERADQRDRRDRSR